MPGNKMFMEPLQMKASLNKQSNEEIKLSDAISQLEGYRFSMSRLSTVPNGSSVGIMLDGIINALKGIHQEKNQLNRDLVQITTRFEKADQVFQSLTIPSLAGPLFSTYYGHSPLMKSYLMNSDYNFPAPISQSIYPGLDKSEDYSVAGKGFMEDAYVIYKKANNLNYEKKDEISGQWGSKGIGNVYYNTGVKDQVINAEFGASVVDSNMGIENSEVSQQVLYGGLKGSIPYFSKIDDTFASGNFIGGKGEVGVTDSTLAGEKSPVSFNFKLANAEAKAAVENYSAGIAAEVSAAKAEVKFEPFNWLGYKPLEEFFGIESSPYFALEAALGSVGLRASVGLNSEIYGGAGIIGVGFKMGFDKE